MARPIRVSILADPKDFVAGLKQAEAAAEQIETTLSGTEKMFAVLDNSMGKISDTADFIGGEFGRVGAGLTGVGDRLAFYRDEQLVGMAVDFAARTVVSGQRMGHFERKFLGKSNCCHRVIPPDRVFPPAGRTIRSAR